MLHTFVVTFWLVDVTGARGWQRAKSRVIGPAPPAQPTTSLAALTASVATHPSEAHTHPHTPSLHVDARHLDLEHIPGVC